MKKLSKVALMFVLIFALSISVLTGCSTKLTGMPDVNDAVSSNGGLVVQKGNYLYFVNGYVDSASADNNYGKADQGAVYRAKLSNNKLSYDEDGNLKDVECVVPKTSGFAKTGLYIFGDYLYYATPNTEQGRSTGTVDAKLLDFYKVKLDGTGNKRVYHQDENSSDATEFEFYNIENVTYLVVYDTKSITIVNCDNGDKTEISNVSSVVMPKVTEFNRLNNSIYDVQKRVYYTRSVKDGENFEGNVLAYANIVNGEESVVPGINPTATYSVKGLSTTSANNNSYLLFTSDRKDDENVAGLTLYYTAKFDNGELNFSANKPEVMCAVSQANPVYLYTNTTSTNAKLGLITTNANGKLIVISMENEYEEKVTPYSELGKITILKVEGSNVFYYNEENVLNYYDLSANKNYELTENNEVYNFTNAVKFDICGSYAYVFKDFKGKEETGAYLVRVEFLGQTEYSVEFIGELLEKHTKPQEEDA